MSDELKISVGDKVAKGENVYTAISEPKAGIFQARDGKGAIVTLSVAEVLKVANESGN